MNSLVSMIADAYGTSKRTAIQDWVNTQYARVGKIENQSVSLRDVDPDLVIKEVQTMIDSFNLSLETILTGIQVLPGLAKDKSELRPIVFVNAQAVKRYYERAGLKVKDLMIARKGDVVEYTGSNAHITFEMNSSNQNKELMCGFINFLVPGEQDKRDYIGSILIEKEEFEACKHAAIDGIFGGVDMLRPEEWIAHGFCLLMKRIMSDASSVGVMKRLEKEEVDKIKGLIALSEVYYEGKEQGDMGGELVYRNGYGKIIGRMVQRFGVVEQLKQKNAASNVVTLKHKNSATTSAVKRQQAKKVIRPKTSEEKETVSGFGKF